MKSYAIGAANRLLGAVAIGEPQNFFQRIKKEQLTRDAAYEISRYGGSPDALNETRDAISILGSEGRIPQSTIESARTMVLTAYQQATKI